MEQQENRVVLRGTVAEEATLSHQVHGIAFYRFPLAVPRLSGREDRLNILCPHTAPEDPLPQAGAFVEVRGEVRSFNNRSGVGNRLVITVLARELLPSAEEPFSQGQKRIFWQVSFLRPLWGRTGDPAGAGAAGVGPPPRRRGGQSPRQ